MLCEWLTDAEDVCNNRYKLLNPTRNVLGCVIDALALPKDKDVFHHFTFLVLAFPFYLLQLSMSSVLSWFQDPC